MFSAREDSTSSTLRTVLLIEDDEEKTTAFSVTALRDLVARSASGTESPGPEGPPPAMLSTPAFLEKGGPVLIMPVSHSRGVSARAAHRMAVAEAPAASRSEVGPTAERAPAPHPHRAVWPHVRCRAVALAMLTLVVASQPWWWDIGDVRPHRAAHPAVAPALR